MMKHNQDILDGMFISLYAIHQLGGVWTRLLCRDTVGVPCQELWVPEAIARLVNDTVSVCGDRLLNNQLRDMISSLSKRRY